ncbi:MAG: integrase arm-type DNA-binding domain-containing protein [Gammaproteobacteria bacterium]|nr:integrase arm-type DNA-binding domain-containing protein [Gammaproteobacteria bacterium]
MPKIAKPLTDKEIKAAKPIDKPYKLSDGGGLYLLINKDGSKFWRFDYTRPITKKRNTMAFGCYPELSLAEARTKRDDARKLVEANIDPSEHKKIEIRAARVASTNTFELVAMDWLSKQSYSPATLEKAQYLLKLPIQKLGNRPINDIQPIDVLDVCRIAEKEGLLEKARGMLNKCSQVFRYAVACSLCLSDPTRDLRGALKPPVKRHLPAVIDPVELGQLLVDINHYQGRFITVQALRLAPMLFIRPGELRAAKWEDLDLEKSEMRFRPPKTRKQTEVDLVIPLPTQAVSILKDLQLVTAGSIYVFPAIHTNSKCMSENTINQALRRMGWEADQVCGHGFRATARTILEEVLGYRYEWIEMQLGHQVRDANGRAYNRTRFLDQRREMMQRWADYLDDLGRK